MRLNHKKAILMYTNCPADIRIQGSRLTQQAKIRVLQIASGDLWAGAEVQLFTLCQQLNRLEQVRLEVILLNHGKLEQQLLENGVSVSVLNEKTLNAFRIFAGIRRHVRQARPDIIHTHRTKENILGGVAAFFCGKIKSLRTAHGAEEHIATWKKPHKKLIQWLDTFVAKRLQSCIVAVSEELAVQLAQKYRAQKLSTIQNGVNLQALDSARQQALDEAAGDEPVIGLVGRLVPVKRVDRFVQIALAWVNQDAQRNVRFIVYGGGPLYDELVAMKTRYQLEERLDIAGECESIHLAMARLSALLITSDHEGLPMTLLEAMALEVPVIAHAVGGIPAVLNGGCGILLDSSAPEAYVSAIQQILKRPDETRQMTALARRRLEQDYSAEHNAKQYLALYQSLTD